MSALGNVGNMYKNKKARDQVIMMNGQRSDQTSNLPEVSDPEAVYSNLNKRDYDNYMRDYRGFEERLIAARDDTSLIDQARTDAPKQAQIAKDIQQRNIERYGGAGLSNAQKSEQGRDMQRGGQLSIAGGVNNARINQREVNQSTMADLINIGQGLNKNALGMLGDSAQMAAGRQEAYKNAKSQYSSSMKGMGANLGSALLAAWLI